MTSRDLIVDLALETGRAWLGLEALRAYTPEDEPAVAEAGQKYAAATAAELLAVAAYLTEQSTERFRSGLLALPVFE